MIAVSHSRPGSSGVAGLFDHNAGSEAGRDGTEAVVGIDQGRGGRFTNYRWRDPTVDDTRLQTLDVDLDQPGHAVAGDTAEVCVDKVVRHCVGMGDRHANGLQAAAGKVP